MSSEKLRWVGPQTCINDNGQDIIATQLIGARKLVECTATKSGSSEKVVPMGPNTKAIVVYTIDGYVFTHLLRPGQDQFANDGIEGSEEEWAQVGRNYLAYARQFYLD